VSLLHKRLENLEATFAVGHRRYTPELEAYFRALENHRREEGGLPPLPATPAEMAIERKADKRFLHEGLPKLRASPAWQSAENRAQLDAWEHDLRTQLEATETKGD
jgi:hypothetical protein